MDSDSRSLATVPRNGHLDFPWASGEESPKPTRRFMAERCLPPAGEDGRHAASVVRQIGASDRVDATMHPEQPIGVAGTADGTRRETQPPQLPMRHDPVLTICQLRQGSVRTHFFPHTGDKCVRAKNSPHGNICSPA